MGEAVKGICIKISGSDDKVHKIEGLSLNVKTQVLRDLYAVAIGKKKEKNKILLGFKEKELNFKRNETLKSIGAENDSILYEYKFNELAGYKFKLTRDPDRRCPYTMEDGTENTLTQLECGHVVSPDGLLGLGRSLVDKNMSSSIKCQDEVAESDLIAKCGKEIDYRAFRVLANLTKEDEKHFDEKLSENLIHTDPHMGQCPVCNSWIFRENKNDIRFSCVMCKMTNKNIPDFCWNCHKTWLEKGYKHCGNAHCTSEKEHLTHRCAQCGVKKIGSIENVPTTRVCPKEGCLNLIIHDDKCKHIICPLCKTGFCFSCLKMKTKKNQNWSEICGGAYDPCPTGVAPRQKFV